MTIYQKVKLIREQKKLSQEHIAYQLGLSQSQYSRRESGEIKFLAEEVGTLSKILEVPVSQLFGDETNSFTVVTQNGGNFGQYISLPDKLIEQYEKRIAEKNRIIELLEEQLNLFKQ